MPARRKRGKVDVLVTGAAGFIGEQLVKRLLKEGLTVQGADLRAGSEPTLRMDIANRAEVEAVFERTHPQRVVHLAAIVDDRGAPELFEAVNVRGTQHIVDACQQFNVDHLVHVSSIVAMGFDPGPQADEKTPLVFDTGVPYFDTKARSEHIVREAMSKPGLSATIVRPGDVYGPASMPWVIRPLELMRKGLPVLVGGGTGLMAHCHVDNLVEGLFLAATAPNAPGHIVQIHESDGTTDYRRYFTLLAARAGLSAPKRSMPYWLGVRLGRAFDRVHQALGVHLPFGEGAVRYTARKATYSLATAQTALGYEPTISLEDGIASMQLPRH